MRENEYAIMFHAEDRHWWYRHLRRVLLLHWNRYLEKNGIAFVDCGCGTGRNLQEFAAHCHVSVGFDYSPHAVSFVRQRGILTTARADTCAIPLSNDFFDVALSADILCHAAVASPTKALAEMARILKPGGVLMLNLPAYQSLTSTHDRHVGTSRRFTKAQIRDMATAAGLELLRCSYWNSLLFPPIALLRLLRRGSRRDASDLPDSNHPVAGWIAGATLAIELELMKRWDLPVGLSVFAVLRRPADASLPRLETLC